MTLRHPVARVPDSNGILWIDDAVNPDDAVVRLLQMRGYSVDCAATGDAGLKMVRSGCYRATLLDLGLPDQPGLGVLRVLSAEYPTLPIIVITGFAHLFEMELLQNLGASHFHAKPVTDDDIAQTLERLAEATNGTASGHRIAPNSDCLLDRLVCAASNPSLTVPAFVQCAESIRALQSANCSARPDGDVNYPRVDELCSRQEEYSIWTRDLLATLDSNTGNRQDTSDRWPRTEFAARRLCVKTETGYSWRRWRIAARVKNAACELGRSSDHVAQVAYRVGYSMPSQLNRDFKMILGMTPRHFGRCLQSARERLRGFSESGSTRR